MLKTTMELRKNSEEFVELMLFVVLETKDGSEETMVAEQVKEFTNIDEALEFTEHYRENGVDVKFVESVSYTG